MTNKFLIIALSFTVVDWVAVALSWRRIEYIFKPSVLAALLIWIVLEDAIHGQMLWIVIGLLFALVGDILLVLPKERLKEALGCFLITHTAYIIGLVTCPITVSFPVILLAAILIISGTQIFPPLTEGLKGTGCHGLRFLILFYLMTISVMLLTALATLTQSAWNLLPAVLISIGASLFYFSDLILAYQRFINRLPGGRLLNIIPYHIGQIAIAAGSLIHFSNM